MTRPRLVVRGTDPVLGVQFSTTGIATWATEERLINATPRALKDGFAWIGANAVDKTDLDRLRAVLAQDGAA